MKNIIIAIVFLIILAIILFFILKQFLPALSSYLKSIPKGIFILLILGIIGVMIYLLHYIVTYDSAGGSQGVSEEITVQTEDADTVFVEPVEDCIILRGDEIWIDNSQVDVEFAKSYIDECVANGITITVVDDYSLASLHHLIETICKEKGAKVDYQDESWFVQ